jgi:hypothetical protein
MPPSSVCRAHKFAFYSNTKPQASHHPLTASIILFHKQQQCIQQQQDNQHNNLQIDSGSTQLQTEVACVLVLVTGHCDPKVHRAAWQYGAAAGVPGAHPATTIAIINISNSSSTQGLDSRPVAPANGF